MDDKLRQRVLAECYRAGKDLSLADLRQRLGLPRHSSPVLAETVEELCRTGRLRKKGHSRVALGPRPDLLEATLEMNQAGFGFAADLRAPGGARRSGKDPYIGPNRLSTAMHGDRILVELVKTRRDGRSEARVIAVLSRRSERIAGYFRTGRGGGAVTPDDPRFPFEITVIGSVDQPIRDGDAVIVSLHDAREGAAPRGEISEVLGNPDAIEVQYRLVIEKYRLPHRFSPEAEAEAAAAGAADREDRRDLRHINHVTIDGEDARDFDDAVAVKKTAEGYRLFVSIADVGAFVEPGSHVDLEAYERGTSVYFPGAAVHMLPLKLSADLCSLRPDEDRLTLTAQLDFDHTGTLRRKRFMKSVIRSRQRFTYTTIREIVVDRDPEAISRYRPFLTMLSRAAELARLLQTRRKRRGALDFTIPEADIRLDEGGRVVSLGEAERTFAHQMIESFMLAANEAVAETFAERGADLLFRIHEKPDPEKVSDFSSFAETLGLPAGKAPGTTRWYNELMRAVEGTPREYIVNTLLLRTMQQARYSPENEGHFALATDLYCHFTSPIRRYPDLIVHRLLRELLENAKSPQSRRTRKRAATPSPARSLKEAGIHLSERERRAIAGERDMAERLTCAYMSSRIGESFRAVVSGVAETVFFVELTELMVRGAVPLGTLTDDYYLLDDKHHRLIGDVSGRVFQMGDLIDVVLIDVDRLQQRISFTVAQ